jgi:biopolymer transport protein ExbD
MAELNTGSDNGGRRKGQPSRKLLRVDFTPMVDMNMLLITFFMFCTTLATPQIMDIVMPAKVSSTDISPIEASHKRTTTLLLGEGHKIYYYFGFPDYEDMSKLKETDLSSGGLRNVLFDRNAGTAQKIRTLRVKRAKGEISEAQFKDEASKLKKAKDGQIVIIKPADGASYNDLVGALDEMQICGIGRYAVVDLDDGDKLLLEKKNSMDKAVK